VRSGRCLEVIEVDFGFGEVIELAWARGNWLPAVPEIRGRFGDALLEDGLAFPLNKIPWGGV